MKITLESVFGHDLVYVYVNGEGPSGTVVDQTITDIQVDLMFNNSGSWAGYRVSSLEGFGGTGMLFDRSVPLTVSKKARCNVDLIEGNVVGIEFIMPTGMIGSTDLISEFLEVRTANQ